MIRVKLPDDMTYRERVNSFHWCLNNFGDPCDENYHFKWMYGKFHYRSERDLVNGPEEIEFYEFESHEDAVMFLLCHPGTLI